MPTVNGCYIVQITDVNGCSSFSSPYAVNGVGIAEVNLDLGFGLFPNPAANEVYLNAVNAGYNKAKLRMLTIEGKEIYNQLNRFYPDVDDTAVVVMALCQVQLPFKHWLIAGGTIFNIGMLCGVVSVGITNGGSPSGCHVSGINHILNLSCHFGAATAVRHSVI